MRLLLFLFTIIQAKIIFFPIPSKEIDGECINVLNNQSLNCPSERGRCYYNNQWLCRCNHDYYNYDYNSSNLCNHERLDRVYIGLLSIIFGWSGYISFKMKWYGIFILNELILALFIISIIMFCKYYREGIIKEGELIINNRVNRYYIVSLILLLVIWGYTVCLSIFYPYNGDGAINYIKKN